MKSIRWIQTVLLDGKQTSLEIMIGVTNIADRCYVRINHDQEHWFSAQSSDRSEIIQQGLSILQQMLASHTVTKVDGTPFLWSEE